MIHPPNENVRGEADVYVAGRQPEAALKNVQLDYTPLADLVHANLDADYLAVKKILPNCRNSEDPQTVAVMRSLPPFLQKELERDALTSAFAPCPNEVQSNLEGQASAAAVLRAIQSDCAVPDAIYLALKSILPDTLQTECLATLRGFARCIQKRLEAST